MFVGLGREKGDMGPLVSSAEREGGSTGGILSQKKLQWCARVRPARGLKAMMHIGSGISQVHGEL